MMFSMLSALSAVFCFAVSAAELNEKFFDVPAKEIELKNVPVIDLDAPPSFPITLQPYQPPKLAAPLKTVTFEHPAPTFSYNKYQFLMDGQTPRCVKIIFHPFSPDDTGKKTTPVYEGYAGNLLTGQTEKIFTYSCGPTTVNSPSFYFSPDGTKMIFNHQHDPVKSYIIQCGNLKPVKVLHAFKNGRIEGWLNDQIALVNTGSIGKAGGEGLAAFRLSDGKILWRMKPNVDLLDVCPAGRRYIAVKKNPLYFPHPVSDTLFLVDAEQGRVIGCFENTEDVKDLPDKLLPFTFSPSGTRLAGSGNSGKIRIWDVATGKKLTEFSTLSSVYLMWIDEEYLYCYDSLIHIAKQIPVWEYRNTETEDHSDSPLMMLRFGGMLFMTDDDGLERTSTSVRNITLPHDKKAVQKILDLPPEKQFVLRPGMKAALKIDPQFKESKKEIEEFMTKMLKENGVEIVKTAPVTVSVFVHINYETITCVQETGQKIDYIDKKETRPVYSETRVSAFCILISVKQGEELAWRNTQGSHYFDPIEDSPFIRPQNDKILDFDDSPAKYAENMVEKILAYTVKGKQPYKELLFKDKLPKQIPNPAIRGMSVISPDGTITTDPPPQHP